jgi:hypothetical protein
MMLAGVTVIVPSNKEVSRQSRVKERDSYGHHADQMPDRLKLGGKGS